MHTTTKFQYFGANPCHFLKCVLTLIWIRIKGITTTKTQLGGNCCSSACSMHDWWNYIQVNLFSFYFKHCRGNTVVTRRSHCATVHIRLLVFCLSSAEMFNSVSQLQASAVSRLVLKLPDECTHVRDMDGFHLESLHTSKVHIQTHASTHFHTLRHTSLLKNVPLGLIHLTLFHKLTWARLQKKAFSEHLLNTVVQEYSLLAWHQSWPVSAVLSKYENSLQIKWRNCVNKKILHGKNRQKWTIICWNWFPPSLG